MIPKRRSMRKEDFPGQEGWIEPLLRMIGDFNAQTVSAMTSGLTFGENMNASLITLGVGPSPTYPVTYQHKLAKGTKAVGVWCVAAKDITAGTNSPVFVSTRVAWKPDGDTVQIVDLPDLTAANRYEITLLTIAG